MEAEADADAMTMTMMQEVSLEEVLKAAENWTSGQLLKAKFDYEATTTGELELHQGDILIFLNLHPRGWGKGVLRGKRGWFPLAFVERLSEIPLPPSTPSHPHSHSHSHLPPSPSSFSAPSSSSSLPGIPSPASSSSSSSSSSGADPQTQSRPLQRTASRGGASTSLGRMQGATMLAGQYQASLSSSSATTLQGIGAVPPLVSQSSSGNITRAPLSRRQTGGSTGRLFDKDHPSSSSASENGVAKPAPVFTSMTMRHPSTIPTESFGRDEFSPATSRQSRSASVADYPGPSFDQTFPRGSNQGRNPPPPLPYRPEASSTSSLPHYPPLSRSVALLSSERLTDPEPTPISSSAKSWQSTNGGPPPPPARRKGPGPPRTHKRHVSDLTETYASQANDLLISSIPLSVEALSFPESSPGVESPSIVRERQRIENLLDEWLPLRPILPEHRALASSGLSSSSSSSSLGNGNILSVIKRIKRNKGSKVFGVPLSDLQKDGREIPLIIMQCVTYLRNNCLQIEGIFRVPGNKDRMEKLKSEFKNSNEFVDSSKLCHAHTVASLLKHFFQELPDPIFPSEYYQLFLNVHAQDDEAGKVKMYKAMFDRMPPMNTSVIKCIFFFLDQVAKNSSVNQMTARNLGIVWGPTLLRNPNQALDVAVTNNQNASFIVEFLIDNVTQIFS